MESVRLIGSGPNNEIELGFIQPNPVKFTKLTLTGLPPTEELIFRGKSGKLLNAISILIRPDRSTFQFFAVESAFPQKEEKVEGIGYKNSAGLPIMDIVGITLNHSYAVQFLARDIAKNSN